MPLNEVAVEEQYYILAASDLPAERALVLKQDDTFALFDRFGDIDSKVSAGEGLYHKGTRFLSCFKLKFANGRPLLLSSTVRRDRMKFRAVNKSAAAANSPALSVSSRPRAASRAA